MSKYFHTVLGTGEYVAIALKIHCGTYFPVSKFVNEK